MRARIFAVMLMLAAAFICRSAAAQDYWPTPGGSNINGALDACLNSSGQAVPWWSPAGVWQCAGTLPSGGSVTQGTVPWVDSVYGPTAVGSPAANPPVLVGGTVDGTAAGNVSVLKVLSGIAYINCANCSGSGVSETDESAFAAGSALFAPGGGFYQTTATDNALTNGQQGLWQMTAQRAGFVNPRNSSGVEIFTSGAAGYVQFASAQAVAAALNATPSLANGNGVVPTQGGSVLGATNGIYANLLQGNAVLAVGNPIFVSPGTGATWAATQSGTWTVQPGNTANTTAWLFNGPGTAGSPSGGVLSVQGVSGGQAVPVSGTFYQTTQPVSLASGAVAAGAFVSGSVLSGAYATGSIVDLVSNVATTAHTCSTGGTSVLGCLGQIDDDVKSAVPTQSDTVPIGGIGLCDGANGTTNPCTTAATVKVASTAAATTDKPLVVALHPSSPTPAPSSDYPFGATPLTATNTGTTGATTATLTPVGSTTMYICGFSIRANATSAATAEATVTGVITATMDFLQWTAPLASGIGITEEIFRPCIPGSGSTQAIAVVSAAPGSGGTVSVSAWGYYK